MEQGPVLGARGFALGPVAAIAGQTRLAVHILGTQVTHTASSHCPYAPGICLFGGAYPALHRLKNVHASTWLSREGEGQHISAEQAEG
jgi:hypothetical protein